MQVLSLLAALPRIQANHLWPDGNYDQVLPSAVEIFIDTEAMGELRKVYKLVDNIDSRDVGSGSEESGDQDQQGDSDDSAPPLADPNGVSP